jgi:2-C-methyl-D-erythritol 4-phosphate cytidylyltransferase
LVRHIRDDPSIMSRSRGLVKTQAIIPTAGAGKRLSGPVSKPLLLLNGKPLFIYALEAIEQSSLIDSMVVVAQKDLCGEFEEIIKQSRLHKVTRIIAGGQTRCESVYNGLKIVDEDSDMILIHDGARPLITTEIVDEAITLCQAYEAVVVAVAVKPTIKKVDQQELIVEETLNREELWEIQTPQVFKRNILLKAYQQRRENNPTDDAVLVEQLGVRVKVLQGDYKNIKVTTKEDLTVAEAFLRSRAMI